MHNFSVWPIMDVLDTSDSWFFHYIISQFQFQLYLTFLLNCCVATCNSLSTKKPSEQLKNASCSHTAALSLLGVSTAPHLFLFVSFISTNISVILIVYDLKLTNLVCYKKLNVIEWVSFCLWNFPKTHLSTIRKSWIITQFQLLTDYCNNWLDSDYWSKWSKTI